MAGVRQPYDVSAEVDGDADFCTNLCRDTCPHRRHVTVLWGDLCWLMRTLEAPPGVRNAPQDLQKHRFI